MPVSTPEPVSLAEATRISFAVSEVPGVAGLHAGQFGEVALLYPRERIRGLRLSDSRLEVHIVLDLDRLDDLSSLDDLAATVRAVAQNVTDLPVDVVIADAASPTVSET